MPKKRRRRSRWGRVFRRGDRWYVSFRWTTGGKPIIRSAADSEDDALDVLRAIKRAMDAGIKRRDILAEFFGEGIPPTITLKDAIPLYLEDLEREKRKRPKTRAGERPRLLRVAKLPWANQSLTEIDRDDVEQWLFGLQRREQLKGSTLNRWATLVSAVYRWAARKRIISRMCNPAREIERWPEPSGREVFLTEAELKAWIAGAPDDFRLMALYYASTGVRRDEARLLQWRSLDLRRGTVRVEADLSKNRTARELPLTPDLLTALHDHRRRVALKNGRLPHGDAYVFTVDGSPWGDYRLRQAFKKTVERAGDAIDADKREVLRLHDIRHTVGAILASKGVPERVIAQFLGHKSLATTRRYAHLYPEATEKAMTVLANAIG